MNIDNQQLAEIIGGLYYGVYEGEDNVESFIEWLENGCQEDEEEEECEIEGQLNL